jgi:co-chaperonin GroES (HSP10)
VVAVGDPIDNGKRDACSVLQPGDRIWVLEYDGNPIKIDGETYRDYRQDSVYGMESRRE